MKKKLIFILLFSLIFCVGCSAKYTIVINEDGSVEERLYATEDENFFNNYPKSSKGLVISYMLDPYIDDLNSNNYKVENNITKTTGGVIITKKYDSIEDYVKNSIIYKQFTDEIKVEKKNGKVTISADGKFSHSEQNQSVIPVDKASIIVEVPYKVEDNNADDNDEVAYRWNFDEKDTENRTITLTYNSKKLGNKADIPVLVILGILGGLLLIGFLVYSRITVGKATANKI